MAYDSIVHPVKVCLISVQDPFAPILFDELPEGSSCSEVINTATGRTSTILHPSG